MRLDFFNKNSLREIIVALIFNSLYFTKKIRIIHTIKKKLYLWNYLSYHIIETSMQYVPRIIYILILFNKAIYVSLFETIACQRD